MSKYPRTPAATVEKMVKDLETESTLAPRTIKAYRDNVRISIDQLEEGRRHVLPWEIDKADVKYLLDFYQKRKFTVQTKRGYISALRKWTIHYGNDVVKSMRIRWPADMRPNADWLTFDQAAKLLAIPKSPNQDLLVHCELCLGMRRIEVLRLTPGSFSGTYVDILGKGPQGGKPRRVPYHRDTNRVYRRYIEYRDHMIALARIRFPASTVVPDALMMWERGGRLSAYSLKGESLSVMLKPLGNEIGYEELSNHTLRRTFGQTMYRSGVPVPTIAKIMGHDSLEMCLKYIGVDLDDMNAAMNSFTLG